MMSSSGRYEVLVRPGGADAAGDAEAEAEAESERSGTWKSNSESNSYASNSYLSYLRSAAPKVYWRRRRGQEFTIKKTE